MALQCSVGMVVYRTPVAELRALFALLLADQAVGQVLIFDNHGDPELKAEVLRHGWHYQTEGKNLGFGAAHNRLLRHLPDHAGAYHLLLNPDISWQDSPLPELLGFLDQHPECGAVMPDVRNPDGSRQYLAKQLPTPLLLMGRRFLPRAWLKKRIADYELRDQAFTNPTPVPLISGCCMLTRSRLLKTLGGFDERYFLYLEDYDLCRMIVAAGFKLFICPDARITHAHGRASYRMGRAVCWHMASALKYFQKWGWKSP